MKARSAFSVDGIENNLLENLNAAVIAGSFVSAKTIMGLTKTTWVDYPNAPVDLRRSYWAAGNLEMD